MLLSKQQILEMKDLPFKDVPVPEWGPDAEVRVSTMSAADRDAFEGLIFAIEDGKAVPKRENYRAKLLSRVLVDEKGNRLFTEKEVDVLGGKSAKAIQRLVDVAQELNGISEAAKEKIEKN